MMKLSKILTSATTGEVTPLLEGRIELSKFAAAFQKMENFYLYPHGPYTKREGTYYVCEAKYRDKKCKLIPFTFSIEQSYVLEFGEYYIRIFMDGGAVAETAKTITGASNGTECEITSVAHGYANGDELYVDDIEGMVELNGKRYRVSDKADDTYKIKDLSDTYVDSSGFSTYTGGGSSYKIYEITTPYAESDLFELQYTQSADVMYITHGDYPVYKLTRTGDAAWTITAVDFIDGPYLPKLQTAIITSADPNPHLRNGLTPSGVSGSITLAAVTKTITGATPANPVVITSAAHGYENGDKLYITDVVGMTEINNRWFKVTNKGANDYELYDLSGNKVDGTGYTAYTSGGTSQDIVFSEADVDKIIRFSPITVSDDSAARWCKITAFTSNKQVTALVKSNPLVDTAVIKAVRMGYWSAVNGYPFSVAFHEQRLALGGCPAYPNIVWTSKAGSDVFEIFTPGVLDADPVIYTLMSNQVNAIKWLLPGMFLSVGTGGSEFSVKSSSLNEPLTPTNVKADEESTIGSASMMPIKIGRSAMYVQTDRRKLFELAYRYSDEGDIFASTDLTLLAEHITEGDIVDMAYAKSPGSILWCVLENGTVVGMTYLKEHEVIGWHRHDFGGVVESVACIPGVGHTETWMSVQRDLGLGGGEIPPFHETRKYIEYMNPTNYKADIKDAFFVDCGVTIEGEPVTVITGLEHLEGETVAILADGSVHPPRVVANGQITLQQEASVVQVGLAYKATATYERADVQLASGTIQDKKKRTGKVTLRLLNSLGCKIGPDENTLTEVRFARGAMGDPSPLFSGDKEDIVIGGGFKKTGQFSIVHDEPLPLTVICAIPTYMMGEE